MKSVREIDDIEQPLFRYARTRGWMCEKLVNVGRRGWPDRTFMRKGVIVFCELKAPGQKPTEQQLKRHEEIRAQGFTVVWFDNLEKAKAYFK